MPVILFCYIIELMLKYKDFLIYHKALAFKKKNQILYNQHVILQLIEFPLEDASCELELVLELHVLETKNKIKKFKS